jgi:hypothetical protein
MPGTTSEIWRNRVGGIALGLFGLWSLISGEVGPLPSRQKIQGVYAIVVGGILLLIGVVLVCQTIDWRDREK